MRRNDESRTVLQSDQLVETVTRMPAVCLLVSAELMLLANIQGHVYADGARQDYLEGGALPDHARPGNARLSL